MRVRKEKQVGHHEMINDINIVNDKFYICYKIEIIS
jgi:hypothetical protein